MRFLISAEDSDKQGDLRWELREHMVTWVQKNHPTALPVSRVSLDNLESSRKPRLKSPS